MNASANVNALSGPGSVARAAAKAKVIPEPLCLETQGREIMAVLVHDVVAEAFRLNLPGAPVERIVGANGIPVAPARGQVTNG
jgi:hypothetical protein